MLTKERLTGMWISVPTEWDEDGNFDEKTFREETAMLIDAGAHGLYTTGSTGEFHALDWEEWKVVQDAFIAETAGKIPVQIGANWFNTRDTIKRVRYARDIGADAVQICFPGWMEMRQEDYDQFLVDVYEAVPDIAIIHYNTLRTKRLFLADDYIRVLPRVPTMIGTKALVPFTSLIDLMTRVPELNHFCRDDLFPLASQLGVKGTYSSWFMMNPKFFLDYYQMCIDGRHAEAIAVTKRLTQWLAVAVFPLLAKGYMDPTLDKAFVQMAGWLPVKNRLTRKPYHPMSEEDFVQLRRDTETIMPEFLNYKP